MNFRCIVRVLIRYSSMLRERRDRENNLHVTSLVARNCGLFYSLFAKRQSLTRRFTNVNSPN